MTDTQTSQRAVKKTNSELPFLTANGDGIPPTKPPAASMASGKGSGEENALIQHVAAMVATARHLPDFELIKAEISADRREAEVAEKTELLKLRNGILEDVRPFINLMKKEHPDESD